MFGEIEAVHRARQIEIAVRVEHAREALGLRLEIAFHRKARRKRTGAQGIAGDLVARKALPPLGGGAVSDRAELACQAHAVARWLICRVVATLPVRIARNRLALHRA